MTGCRSGMVLAVDELLEKQAREPSTTPDRDSIGVQYRPGHRDDVGQADLRAVCSTIQMQDAKSMGAQPPLF